MKILEREYSRDRSEMVSVVAAKPHTMWEFKPQLSHHFRRLDISTDRTTTIHQNVSTGMPNL